jgi:dynein heavy chain 1
MTEVDSPASPNGVAKDAFAVDPILIVEYLAKVIEITLGAARKDLETGNSLLSKSRYQDTISRCTRFASENQVALYVTKDIASAGGLDGSLDGTSMFLGSTTENRAKSSSQTP